MNIELRSRRAGKTTAAIHKAAETKAYIIVPTEQDKRRIVLQAEDMGVNIRHPVTLHEFLNDRMRGSWVRNVVIDDADRFLETLFEGLKIEMATINDDFAEHTAQDPVRSRLAHALKMNMEWRTLGKQLESEIEDLKAQLKIKTERIEKLEYELGMESL